MSEEEKSPTAQESLLEEIPPTLEKHDDLTPVTEIENTYVSRAREVVPQSSDFVNVIRNTVGEADERRESRSTRFHAWSNIEG